MKKLLTMALAAYAFAGWAGMRSVTPAQNDAGWAKSWWEPRHEMRKKEALEQKPQIVFLGDSITHFWESRGKAVWDRYFAKGRYKALNLGFSGDRTEHVLWRIDNGAFDGYEAKAIVLMIGTNNSGHWKFEDEPPTDTIIGIREIIRRLKAKQPKAKIVLCSIFPRGRKADDPTRIRNQVVNREIRKFADAKDVLWCDFGEQFLMADGFMPAEIMPDALHPGEAGYEIWASAVMPFLDYALDSKPGDGRFCPSRWPSFAAPGLYEKEGLFTAKPASMLPDQCWWKTRLQEKREEILAGPKEYDAVLVGDSITHRWEREGGEGVEIWAELKKKYKLLNLGYGGDKTQNVLWRLEYGELEGYKAKMFVVMIGTNNPCAPHDVAKGVEAIVATLRRKHPEAKVLLHPIFPRSAKPTDGARVRNDKANEMIKKWCANGKDAIWWDFNAKLLEADGTLTREMMPDLLHPGPKGYAIWRDELEKAFAEHLGK